MSPDRKDTINGHRIEEFYWAGRMVTYVDNQLTSASYDAACALAREGKPMPAPRDLAAYRLSA